MIAFLNDRSGGGAGFSGAYLARIFRISDHTWSFDDNHTMMATPTHPAIRRMWMPSRPASRLHRFVGRSIAVDAATLRAQRLPLT
jgi:hypothetical protein